MKKLLLTLLAIGCLLTAYPQGTVSFTNGDPLRGVNAPIYESNGVTGLSGQQFMAQLFAGPSANSLASIAMMGFSTGVTAGYFFGGTQTINTVGGGDTAWIQVDVWNTGSGASFPQAKASGLPDSWWQSSLFTVQTGNFLSGTGPTPPAALTGLGTSPLFLNSVPEPSTFALAGLAVVVMLQTRRRTLRGGH